MNLTDLLDRTASRWPDKPALIEGAAILSYAGLLEKVAAYSAALRASGISSGTRVGLCYPNSIDYVALTFALWRLNAVVVPIPSESAAEECCRLAETLRLQAILTHKPRPENRPLSATCHFAKLTPESPPENHGLNIAFIRFTSGTTHARKGVVLCHETIRDRILAANQALRIGPDDIIMWCLPMSHHFLITIALYLSQGATIVLTRHVVARSFLEEVNRRRGTVLYSAPFHYALLARESPGLRLSSVRLAVSTTCALPQDVAADFSTRFGFNLSQALGIIELGLVSLNSDDPRHRWSSVGKPVPGCRVKVLTPDADGCGEIAVAGPGFFDAYAEPWLFRDQLLADGWFRTGDMGWLDEDGFLFLAGRKTAVINLAGRKVFPEEIEAVLNRHPAVRESRVYGRLHPHLGEVVEAEVVMAEPDTGPGTLRGFSAAKPHSLKIPTRFHVVNSLARTAVTGKLRRPAALAWHD